jgi:HAMP domain-containing protein
LAAFAYAGLGVDIASGGSRPEDATAPEHLKSGGEMSGWIRAYRAVVVLRSLLLFLCACLLACSRSTTGPLIPTLATATSVALATATAAPTDAPRSGSLGAACNENYGLIDAKIPIIFDGRDTTDLSMRNYQWSFSNGSPRGGGVAPTHVYRRVTDFRPEKAALPLHGVSYTYDVTLWVIDDAGRASRGHATCLVTNTY